MNNFEELISSEQAVLVDFFATWCAPCKMLAPILVDLKKDVGDKLKIIKIDVDKNSGLTAEYGAKYQMRGVPTMMLFKNGKMLWKHSGVLMKNDILNQIKPYI